jgi:hypothetical protein
LLELPLPDLIFRICRYTKVKYADFPITGQPSLKPEKILKWRMNTEYFRRRQEAEVERKKKADLSAEAEETARHMIIRWAGC